MAETIAAPPGENLYEGMFLVDSGKFASDPEGLTGKIVELVENAGGTIAAHRPWQDGKLAYPIEGHRKGLHYLVCFRMPPANVKDLERACRLSDTILRHMVIKQPPTLYEAMVAALTGADEEEGEAEESK